MKMDNTKLLESIEKRLGVLIALQIRELSESFSVADGVELLSRFGLSPTEIAEILDTSSNTVSVTRSRLKKRK
jgi:DNA-binding CsgD family transcriptional regulator